MKRFLPFLILTLCSCGVTDNQLGAIIVENDAAYRVSVEAQMCGFTRWEYLGRVKGGKTEAFAVDAGCWNLRAGSFTLDGIRIRRDESYHWRLK